MTDWRLRATSAILDERALLALVDEIIRSPSAPRALVQAAVNVRSSLRLLMRRTVRPTPLQRDIATLRTAHLLSALAEPPTQARFNPRSG